MRGLAYAAGLLFVFCAASQADAYIIYTTGGLPDYDTGGGGDIRGPSSEFGELDRAIKFTTTSDYLTYSVTSVKLPLRKSGGDARVDVMITADNGNQPGEILKTVTVNAPTNLPYPAAIVTADFSGDSPLLYANSTYWLRLSSPSDGYNIWLYVVSGGGTEADSWDNGTTWDVSRDGEFLAMAAEISGTPEPATLSLLALGGLALIRRRRK
jgi:hypothetical protein